jgi:hypothetical protein
MPYSINLDNKYIYLRSYDIISVNELSEIFSNLEYLNSNNKIKNILVDISECEKFSDSICIFYETIKKTQFKKIAFFTRENQNSINFLDLILILSEIKSVKLDVYSKKEEVKKWINNLI